MAIIEISDEGIRELDRTTFARESLRERDDLQRYLKRSIDTISPDTIIIAEEYGAWMGSLRRIDLLGLDADCNLVVIELKRTEDGGHMEL